MVRSHHYFFMNIFFYQTNFNCLLLIKSGTGFSVSVQLQNASTEVEISNFYLEITKLEFSIFKFQLQIEIYYKIVFFKVQEMLMTN